MTPRVLASLFFLSSIVAWAQDVGSSPARLDRPDTARLAKQVEAELRGNVLPFWLNHARDRSRGGFYGEIRNDLTVKAEAPRGALLTARILWTFSAAYRRYRDPAYLEMARWAYADLRARFWDQENGGLFWSVTADGTPKDRRKITYVQAFGIYGLSEFYRATGEQPVLDRAVELYRVLEQHGHDRTNLGYFEEFSPDWRISRQRGGRGLSPMGSLGQKSQNVHLHLLEAFTNLARVWPDDALRRNLREVADVLLTRVLDSSNQHLRLFLDEDWKPASDEISFGHDIEFSWLITEAAEEIGDAAFLAQARKVAVTIAAVTHREGVDPDGGVLSEADPHGVTNAYKEWWPQAEAAVGFFNAYQISGEAGYLRDSAQSWAFIEAHLIDRRNGEWFQGVTRDGKVVVPLKLSFWKCPYHNGRACLELLDRIAAISPVP